MNTETITWIWFVTGILLMLSELLIPGLVVIFLGLAAVFIALGRWFGWIDNLLDSFTYWFVLTVAIILVLRGFVARFASGDSSSQFSSEDESAFGRMAKVTEEVGSDHDDGRIQFRGTTWKARSEFGRALAGQRVKIVGRENLVLIVDPVVEEDYPGNPIPVESLAKKIAKKHLIGAKKSRNFVKRAR